MIMDTAVGFFNWMYAGPKGKMGIIKTRRSQAAPSCAFLLRIFDLYFHLNKFLYDNYGFCMIIIDFARSIMIKLYFFIFYLIFNIHFDSILLPSLIDTFN